MCHVKRIIFVIVSILYVACGIEDSKFIRKRLNNSEVEVTWYYYSYITNVSPDFVEIRRGDSIKVICEAGYEIVDVKLGSDQVEVRFSLPADRQLSSAQIFGSDFFGYPAVFDSSGTTSELRLIPDGVKEP